MISEYEALKQKIAMEDDCAWTWHCNIAMAILDSEGFRGMGYAKKHTDSNRAARLVMQRLFDVDVSKFPEYVALVGAPE
jgi:hypothetical protein